MKTALLSTLLSLSIPCLIYAADPDSATLLTKMADAAGKQSSAPQSIFIDYPFNASVFPPEIVAPTFLWHDAAPKADCWLIEITAPGLKEPIYQFADGKQPSSYFDHRAVSPSNEHYQRDQYDIDAKAWTPDPSCWEQIKDHSKHAAATISIYGFSTRDPARVLSRGIMTLATSTDEVGAPIFYRDVPLMPTPDANSLIQPISPDALDLIAWRLRDISKARAPIVLENMPTCANCHSFSQDGATLGMDIDGPDGDKGAYALAEISQDMVIENEDILTWGSYEDSPKDHKNFGLFSRVSPNGRYVVSTLNESVFVVNYTDFRFLQSFYPTRGILVVYDRETQKMTPLPGASSTRYVQTNACWTPDGKRLIFSRARARDKNEHTSKPQFAGDERETNIQYDLYSIPFNGGKGGKATPIKGASKNGMSNSFPKVSPDGKWLVYVQSKKGQLLRPDSRLYIVPVEGGEAREMSCNLKRMNSWHSWSPNSRWMVFSSKGFSPFTQMFLTHIDENGLDTPAILIPNSTAANRAVNIPEFLNGPGDAITRISAPVQRSDEYHKDGVYLVKKGKLAEALVKFNQSISLNPYNGKAFTDKGVTLRRMGHYEAARTNLEQAVKLMPDNAGAYFSLGGIIEIQSQDEAIAYYEKVLKTHPDFQVVRGRLAEIYLDREQYAKLIEHCTEILKTEPGNLNFRLALGIGYFRLNQTETALIQFEQALKQDPGSIPTLVNLSWILASHARSTGTQRKQAVELAKRAAELTEYHVAGVVDALAVAYAADGQFALAAQWAKTALELAQANGEAELARNIATRLNLFRSGQPYTE